MATLITFILFTALVAVMTWVFTRGKATDTEEGYFLAGRSLGGLVIAGSLLLTNLSTEQLVGLNGGAFKDGLSVMCWEVIAGMSLVAMALFFLPRYLKSGITTIPEFLEKRYDGKVRALTTGIFIIAYMLILLPFVLYLGATGLSGMLNLDELLNLSDIQTIWLIVIFIAIVGSAYAIFGGLRAVAISDTFNGIGLLVGGLLITWFCIKYVSGESGSISAAIADIKATDSDAFVSLGSKDEGTHWPTLFTGVLLLNFFYWCSNQQIIQRTFGAKNLAEGQKGVLLAAFFKILAPLILIIPGIIGMHIATTNNDFRAELLEGIAPWQSGQTYEKDATVTIDSNGVKQGFVCQTTHTAEGTAFDPSSKLWQPGGEQDSKVYGSLVRLVLPGYLTGFFAAVVVGSILSTFNSVLNSSATLFSLGVYKKVINENATTQEVVKAGRICSAVVAVLAAIAAPIVFHGKDGIFNFFQSLNGVYFIPLAAIILIGFFHKRANATSALITATVGLLIMLWGTIWGGDLIEDIFFKNYHFMGAVFAFLVILQICLANFLGMSRDSDYIQEDVGKVDLTPWKHAKWVGCVMIAAVLILYLALAKG